MQEYDLSQWVLFFFLYSFLGWIWESCYVSVRKRRWVNRGFMHGPMLPLYGSGAMVVLIVTIPVRDNILLVFLMGMIGATILEYFTGITMERLFHVRYWDYRNLKFNVRGYICPLASLCWGVFSILMVKVVHIPFEHIVLLIPVTIADILAFVLTIAAAVDFTQSFNEAMDMKRILVQLEASKEQIQKMQERLKDASEEMQDRLKDASEGVQERLKRASEGVQERLEDSYLLYEERKEMKAAEKQISDIELIDETVGLYSLPDNLQEIAELRYNNPDFNLKDLGAAIDPPISRSGANHRLQKIAEIADRIRVEKGLALKEG